MIEASLDPLVTFDHNGIIMDVNEATVRVTGRTREELIGTPFADYFTKPEKASEGVMLVFETGEVRDYELVIKARDGSETIVAYNASVYKDETGQVVGAFAAARDITLSKRAEQEIHNLQNYNRGLIEVSLDPLVTFDHDGIILDVNKATIKATGRNRDELLGTPFADYFTDPEKAHKGAMEVFETGEVRDYELVMKAKDGTETIVAYNASVYKDETGQVVGAFAAARDITGRKRAEQEIQNLQSYNRGLIEASLDPLVTFDHKGIILDVNETTIRATGRTREELIGTPFADYFTDPEKAHKGAMMVFETGEVRDYELVMKAKDGTKTIVAYNASVYTDQSGNVIGAFAAARDITERKLAEQEIQNLQSYNRGLIEVSLDPLVTFDHKGIILDVNETTIRTTGRTREELIGTPFADYFTEPEKAHKGAMMVFKVGEVRDYELVMKAKDGTETIVAYNASVYTDQSGNVVGAFAAARDITERKRAEQEIQNLQSYNRGLIEASLDPLVTFDRNGIILDVNEAKVRIVGRSREELIGTPFSDHFTDPERAYKGAMQVFETGEVRDYELVMKAKDGTETIVVYNATVYKDQDGNIAGAFGAARDITERKRAEQEIQTLQSYNRGLIEASLDPLVTFDRNGIILDVNEAKVRITGRSREELIGTPFSDHFTDPERAYKGAMQVFETGEVRDYELVMKAKDGTETIVVYNATVYEDQDGNIAGAFGAARDITERKRAEQEIQNLQSYNRGLIEASLDPLVTFDRNGIILDVNEAKVRITGRSREELIGTPFSDHFADSERAYKVAMKVFETGEVRDYELVMKAKDGTETIVSYNASVYRDPSGKVVGAFGAARDITDRKRAEQEIQNLQSYNRGLIEASLDPLVTFDRNGIILDVNEAKVRITGRSREELIGTPFSDHFTDPERAYKGAMKVFETGEVRDYELVMKAKDKTETFVLYNATVYRDQTGKVVGAFGAARDISERKRIEQALHSQIELEKLISAISTDFIIISPGEIDNEINNALKAIGEYSGVDRSYIFQFYDNGNKMDNTYEWCKKGIEPQIDILKGISIEENYPNFIERLWRLEVIHVPKVADLPPEATFEKENFEKLGIKSLIFVPIVYGQNHIGFLAFDSVETEKTWNETDIRLLKMVGEIFANALERKRADLEIQNLQHYNRGLIEVSLDPLVTFNQEGIILDVNEATIEATGRSREELIGTPFADYFTDPEKAQKGAMKVFETGEVRDYELVMKARDGTETIVAYNASVYRDQEGNVVGAFAAARDITERKRSEHELEETIQKLEAYTGRINRLMTTTLEQVTEAKSKGVILDITGVPADIEITQPLINIARYARQFGATCIITGIKPEIERELMELGAILAPITTERSLHDGLRYTIAIIDES